MLQSLNTAKSSGHDGIFARMLKPTANVIASSITKLFNLSIQLGQPPTAWKTAKGTNDFRLIILATNPQQDPGKALPLFNFCITLVSTPHCQIARGIPTSQIHCLSCVVHHK